MTLCAVTVGAVVGLSTAPAFAASYSIGGDTQVGQKTYHGVFRWHYSSFPYANFNLKTISSSGMCGGSMYFLLYNGKGGESSEPSWGNSTLGQAKSFLWNGSTTLPYPESYAVRSRNNGGFCGLSTLSWTGTLNL